MIKNNIYNLVKECIFDYKLISSGDRVLLGVSGGKDSMCCYSVLKNLAAEFDFKLKCAYVPYPVLKLPEDIEAFLRDDLVFANVPEIPNEINCYKCANIRRRALLECAKDIGFNKVALAHNYEDNSETCMLNIFSGGKIEYLEPKLNYFNEYTLIRPFLYVSEKKIRSFVERNGIPVCENKCENLPNCGRIKIRNMLKEFQKKYPDIYEHINNIKF